MGDSRPHTLVVRPPKKPGEYLIRGRLSVGPDPRNRDEGEFVLPLRVSGDSVYFGECRTLRQERVRGGRRYRYGGMCMVPVDSGEVSASEDDIMTRGKRPHVLRGLNAKCDVCPEGASVLWLAFVGSDGGLREARPLNESKGDSTLVIATRNALAGHTFAPASLDGRFVSDYLIVEVQNSR